MTMGELVRPTDLAPRSAVAASSEEQVRAAVRAARAAQPAWEALGFDARAERLTRACKAMLERRKEAVSLLLEEGGKYPPDALLNEAVGPLEFLKQWIKVARPYLRSRKLPVPRLAFPGKHGRTDVVARGVVGIIAPWNYPVATYFKPVFPALLCGNAVVVKPSEYSPKAGAWFASILEEFLPKDVLHVVQGDALVGVALVKSGIDAITFTGSVGSGKKVLVLAAEQMIPCDVELGGKDPAIVLPDCNLDRTVAGVLKWSMHNAGQDCGSIERVYVPEPFADTFVPKLASAAGRLRYEPPADDPSGFPDIGPLNNPRQLAIVEAHVKDAVAKGAKVLCGGEPVGKGLFFKPTVLDRCDHSMRVVQEETFGPVVPIVRVKDVEEAVRLANDSAFGLCASVWSEDLAKAERLALRLEAGTVYVNNHALTGAMPFAPWTGVKNSGYGIANSVFALGHYTRPRTLFVDTNRDPDPWWFPLDPSLVDIADRLAEAQLGHFLAALKLPGLMKARTKRVLAFVKNELLKKNGA